MKTLVRFALPLLAIVLFSGCFSSGSSRSARASDGRASLVVVNNSPKTIYYLYASPCSSTSWGSDRLDSDQVISSGQTVAFTMTTGCWDFKAVFSDDTDVVRRNANITDSSWRWTIG
ncbi:hypothetical protein B1759_04735 [Rubrivirga sp. SAORIC476]|uniref:hypothetical protein n=1 Tax=Rubrivirga sp. SAORIC476 TaxID=1961794 RepID=UPI000BA91B1D|nr:hypothetical protein [Rubrivirga sp. SAORIC476]MAQ95496.1 hypothetical protein [Rhodothermaceae bacterium]MBC11794.1 hypothetical protein [Rhodothermaceae bacterium]PAP80686.1 hypothetical protein B1759_04735 [Rubrivirga sp. SAORIC476]